jgi:protein-S-isoprenylcysteine O-methyltransferase Ste14
MGYLAFIYGAVSYAAFLAVFLYAIAFVGDFAVPKTINSGEPGPLGAALVLDTLLLGLFAVQHSVMARPGFKRWWTRIVPRSIERSTYVLLASLALALLFWQWRPIPGTLWKVESQVGVAILYGLFALGWVIVLLATFMINHFDLFGLRQVWLYLIGAPYRPVGFRTPGPYRLVRHPLYVGWFFAFWSTPTMTVTHFVFALATAGYILVAIQLEERDLIAHLGNDYRDYRKRVPMLIPRFGKTKPGPGPTAARATR